MTRVVLCADDFALSPGVSAGIARLAADGCIDAISVMTVMDNWASDFHLLKGIEQNVELGLHLTLCDERPLGNMPTVAASGVLPSTAWLTMRSIIGGQWLREVEGEIERQFDAFEKVVGRPPDFVDAHKHCHLLPRVRQVVLDVTRKRAPRAWVRSCADRARDLLARPFRVKAIASALWSWRFEKQARDRGLTTNDGFAGHYDFGPKFAEFLPLFISSRANFHLVMCHPGLNVRGEDELWESRRREFQVLGATRQRKKSPAA